MHPTLLIEMVLSFGILAVLVISCFYDLKYREVSNKLTGMVWILAIPLVYLYSHPLLLPVIFSFMLLALFETHQMGGADVKVLIPLLFIVPDTIFLIFMCSLLGIIYAFVAYGKNINIESTIPHFIPITMTYGLIIFNIYT